MDPHFRELEQRLATLDLDEHDAAEPFSRRLARENRWSEAYAQRVLQEYKRFALLAMSAAHSVTPSDAVDQAWHLHLTYTEAYSQAFCKEVLGRPLHHRPSRGGPDEFQKYQRDYEQTLSSYRLIFGEDPPTDIWPPLRQRFLNSQRWVRVNAGEHWILPKSRFEFVSRIAERWPARGRALAAGGVAALLLATGCASLGLRSPLDLSGPNFLFLFLALYVAGWIGARRASQRAIEVDDREPERKLHACEVAFLTGGPELSVNAAIANLVGQKVVSFDAQSGALRQEQALLGDFHPVEREVYDRLRRGGSVNVSALRAEADALTSSVASTTVELGLISKKGTPLPLLIALAAPALGVLKILVGLARDKPVGLLVVLVVAGTLLAVRFFRPRPSLSAKGKRRLATLRAEHETLRGATPRAELLATGLLPMAVGLFGVGLLADSALAAYSPLFASSRREGHPSHSGHSGGGDSSGGDGGGDGGGGCGGCGGCGGGGG